MDTKWSAEQLAQKYQFHDDMLKLIIEAIPANVFFKDTACRYQMVSHLCTHLNGDIIGKTDLEVQPDPELARFFYDDDKMILATRKGNRYISEMIFNGEKYYYEIIKTPVINSEGDLIGILGLINDVTEMKRLQEELRLMSITDKLTGVYNRAYFEEKFELLVLDDYTSLSIIMCDSNGLKYFNDNFSHKEGDRLLIETANILKKVIGDAGDIIRIGGDEFAVFCLGRSDAWCRNIIEELKKAERENEVLGLPISNAYGYATLNNSMQDLQTALTCAEKMMYTDKAKDKSDYIDHLISLAAGRRVHFPE